MKCKNYAKLISELLQRLPPSFVAFSYLLSTRREAKKKKKQRSREEKAFSVIASLSHGTAKKEERERGGEGKDDGLHYEFQRGNPHIQQSLTSALHTHFSSFLSSLFSSWRRDNALDIPYIPPVISLSHFIKNVIFKTVCCQYILENEACSSFFEA